MYYINTRPTVPKSPSMDPHLLPVQITNLQHAKLTKEQIGDDSAPPPRNQASEPFLIPQEEVPLGGITCPLGVNPYHEAILEVGEDQSIIE